MTPRKKAGSAAVPMAAPAAGPGSRWRRPALAAGLAALAALTFGLRGAQSTPMPSPFRVEVLEVRGLRLLHGDMILAASGIKAGAELFDIDPDRLAARLRRLVWVREARVVRRPPDRLIVHLEERRRTAWVDWRGVQYGLDPEGVLLPPERLPAESIEDLDLPVLRVRSLVAGDTVRAGRVVTDSTALLLLTWLREASEQAPDLTSEISQLTDFDGFSLGMRLVADGLEVRVPPDRVGERMAVLREVLERVYREVLNPSYVDLRFAGQAVVGSHKEKGWPGRRTG